MGTPEFAVSGLKKLVENNYQIVAVITSPDKPQGRGLKLGMSPVKEYALSVGLPVLQPEKLKDETFLTELKSYQADLQIVVAFRMLPEAVWNMPKLGTFNLHASLLPQYRGAAPIHWAIINGEKETGVTTFFLKHEIDTGDLIMQEKEPIFETDTTGLLYERLMNKGADVILETVRKIESGNYKTIPQIENHKLKSAPKIFKEHCKIDWKKTAFEIYNFVRGMNPVPTAFCECNGLNCKIFETQIIDNELVDSNFETDNKNYLYIKTAKKTIAILSLQIEGKKRMSIKDFLIGNKVLSIN